MPHDRDLNPEHDDPTPGDGTDPGPEDVSHGEKPLSGDNVSDSPPILDISYVRKRANELTAEMILPREERLKAAYQAKAEADATLDLIEKQGDVSVEDRESAYQAYGRAAAEQNEAKKAMEAAGIKVRDQLAVETGFSPGLIQHMFTRQS
jgi:hypothetical protein